MKTNAEVSELIGRVSVEDLAAGLYEAACRMTELSALGEGDAPPPGGAFTRLSFEAMAPWFQLARKGPLAVESCEGMRFGEIAGRLFGLLAPPEEAVARERYYREAAPAELKLVWEALARYLSIVIDCEDAGSLQEVESVVANWFKREMEVLRGRQNTAG